MLLAVSRGAQRLHGGCTVAKELWRCGGCGDASPRRSALARGKLDRLGLGPLGRRLVRHAPALAWIEVEPDDIGELQARSLGAKVEAWSEDGRPLVGEVGELVITEPLPSMPLCLWDDEDGSRYRESYFTTFPGVWRHGDWIEITSRGTAVIYGRSDSTVNRGGVRMGTSEIYRAVLACDDVVDALVVDVPREGTDGWMSLFVVLRDGAALDSALEDELRRRIRTDCSPRHVPDEIRAVPEIPRTLSGKILEVPVKRILAGEPPEKVASRGSLANPAALDWFTELAGRSEKPDSGS